MRTSEWIQAGFAIVLAAAAWVQPLVSRRRPLPVRRRSVVTLLALIPVLAVILARTSALVFPPLSVSILRDWLPVALFLVPYWQAGQFFQGPDPTIEKRLLAFDVWLMPKVGRAAGTPRTRVGALLETGYLFCYPVVPLGVLALYGLHQQQNVASFWPVVLLATYLCYGITPFVPALPPRALAGNQAARGKPGKTRILNRWILQHGSIHAISFPSAHVASSFAVALVLLRDAPAVGAAFLVIAVWIAVGAVVGRYHYALDAVMGLIAALAVFLACYPFL